MKLKASLKSKKLVVFDLDGTLTPSKSPLTRDVREALVNLLEQKPVAIIGGGKYGQFAKQFLAHFRAPAGLMEHLYLFPTTSTAFYLFHAGRYVKVYEHLIPKADRSRIMKLILSEAKAISYPFPAKPYGKTIEDRGTQITFSALGQDIVDILGPRGVRIKEDWNKKYDPIRQKLAARLRKKLPKFSVTTGGSTSIDITKKGIDKGYGVRQISKRLKFSIKDIVFIGDALYKGGNDAAAKKSGVDCVQVSGPHETKKVIGFILGKNR